jgi:hypothetical protein
MILDYVANGVDLTPNHPIFGTSLRMRR